MTDCWSGKKTIKRKLMTLLLTGISLLLLAISLVAIGYEFSRYREERSNELVTLGELFGRQLSAAVATGDAKSAREILDGIASARHVLSAEVVTSRERVLAQYHREDETARAIHGATLQLSRPITRGNRVVGKLHLVSQENLFSTVIFLGALLASALLAIAGFGILLSRRLRLLISGPIEQLTGKMEIVSRDQDYGVRVEKMNDDELGLLSDCFNEMLAEISVRDERLALHSEELKLEVADRTRELSNVNRQLAESLDEVRRAMQTAQAASKAKSEFLAQMSHEIRTPMYGVLGMTELLQGTDLSKEQARFVDTVRRSGQALLSIINNILDFSKIEAGRMELEIIPFDLHELVAETVELFSEDAGKKGLELRCDIARELPRSFLGDPGRLRQVIVNLLGNALKFTHKGAVTLVAFMDRPPDLVRISVTDTGIGIAPDVQDKIFVQFSQGDESMTRKYGGTGLGLAIAKQLTELMGGEIRVASDPGKGSTFSFTVRLDAGSGSEWVRPNHSRIALRGKRALVASSDPALSEMLMGQLTGWGMDCEAVQDAPGAVCRVVAAPFDLAVLDQQVGGAGGMELAATIRSLPAGRLLRLVLLGSRSGELGGRAEEVGVLLFSRNELRPHRLYAALVRALGMEQSAGEFDADGGDTQRRPPLVLLVEDNPVNQEVGRGMLESLGCNVEIAANGLVAVETVQKNSYDLVLMDYQMPVMDGLEAIRTIRGWENGREHSPVRLPIVSLTACAMSQDRQACMDAGADDYLSKPFTRDELARTVSRQLQRSRPEAQTAAEGTAVSLADPFLAEAPVATGAGGGAPETSCFAARVGAPVISREKGERPGPAPADPDAPLAEDRMSGAMEMIRTLPGNRGKEILRKVVELYLTSTPALLQTLREAESGGDAEKLKAAAHSFKSSSANLGAMRLAGVCRELEALGRSGSTEGALPLLLQVEEEYRVVRDALQGGQLC
ncbi:MAG TPA: response regulator [Geomonas sp.]|nr:response regulator [Geomonas sp.]